MLRTRVKRRKKRRRRRRRRRRRGIKRQDDERKIKKVMKIDMNKRQRGYGSEAE